MVNVIKRKQAVRARCSQQRNNRDNFIKLSEGDVYRFTILLPVDRMYLKIRAFTSISRGRVSDGGNKNQITWCAVSATFAH